MFRLGQSTGRGARIRSTTDVVTVTVWLDIHAREFGHNGHPVPSFCSRFGHGITE